MYRISRFEEDTLTLVLLCTVSYGNWGGGWSLGGGGQAIAWAGGPVVVVAGVPWG